MKNNMKRDAKPNGKSAGAVVTLSTARLAAPGRPPGGAAIRAATRSGGSLPAPLGERRPAVRRSIKAAAKARTRRASRRMPIEKVIKESERWLDIISRHDRLTPAQKKRVVKETVKSFDAYFNSGFLAYCKSVAEAEQFASIEWTGPGTLIEDIMGRQYIDCNGGFGI